MLGGADNPNGELLSYIIGADTNEVFLTHDRFYNAVRSFLQHCQ